MGRASRTTMSFYFRENRREEMAIAFGQLGKYEVEAWFTGGDEVNQFYKSLPEAKAAARKLKQEGALSVIIHDYTGANPNGIRV